MEGAHIVGRRVRGSQLHCQCRWAVGLEQPMGGEEEEDMEEEDEEGEGL
jgi:hypothetical protein